MSDQRHCKGRAPRIATEAVDVRAAAARIAERKRLELEAKKREEREAKEEKEGKERARMEVRTHTVRAPVGAAERTRSLRSPRGRVRYHARGHTHVRLTLRSAVFRSASWHAWRPSARQPSRRARKRVARLQRKRQRRMQRC